MREKVITRIEPKVTIIHKLEPVPRRKRVAAYARVSTASDEQLGSIEAQQDYYSKYILDHEQWDFVGVYADRGLSGTSSKRRPAFQQMVEDALAGNIDMILTKSLSRFARNTVDTLKTIRELKAKNIEVYFEKEDISTLDSKGEFLITLMSSIAQEESRSISENVAWGIHKRFADGKFSVPYKHFLGYDRESDGKMVINTEQAEIVRLIYLLYLEGRTYGDITRVLMGAGIKTPAGKETWSASVVESILTNEKYYGAALLQKKFTYDFLSKKARKNCGELPQYYIEDDHTPIVSKAHYDAVQERMVNKSRRYCTRSPFAGKLICSHCKQLYGRKKWHSTVEVWECPQRFQGNPKCPTPHIYETQLVESYQQAFMMLLAKNLYVIDCCHLVLKKILPEDRYAYASECLNKAVLSNGSNMTQEPSMWLTLVENVLVCEDGSLCFQFVDGNEILLDIPARKKISPIIEDSHISIIDSAVPTEKELTTEGVTGLETVEMKIRHRLSELDKRKITELKIKGFGNRRIAQQLQLNPDSVKSFIRRHGSDSGYVATLGICMCCGSSLSQTPGKKPKKFCSDACRMKWWAEHKEQLDRTTYTNKCEYCGRPFQTARQNQKFCCRACFAESRKKNSPAQ